MSSQAWWSPWSAFGSLAFARQSRVNEACGPRLPTVADGSVSHQRRRVHTEDTAGAHGAGDG